MSKPIILAVDHVPDELQAIQTDLRHRLGVEFRIAGAASGERALAQLERWKLRGSRVALVLSELNLPGLSGLELMARARELFPEAKRMLLTALADSHAAIEAINSASLDYYLLKPWDPPEERLYPVVQDLLDDWRATARPPYEGVRIVAYQWSREAHETRRFLAGNQVAFRSLIVEQNEEARRLAEQANAGPVQLPLVVLPDGSMLSRPSNVELAERLGLHTRPAVRFYDLIIVGGGPAGLAAAVYGASEGLHTVIVEREAPGGQAGSSSRIENYLGFPTGLSGSDLARRAVAQAERFGVEMLTSVEATSLRADGQYRYVGLSDGIEISSHAVIVATGVSYRRLRAPGIEPLEGAGVYYGAATTEALFCAGDVVYVVGAANSAGQGAMHLAHYAGKVVILARESSLADSMSQYLIDQLAAQKNIEVQLCSEVVAVDGHEHLESITIADIRTGETRSVPARAMFIFIGATPYTDWAAGVLARDEDGHIVTDQDIPQNGEQPTHWPLDRAPFLSETSMPGVFAVGDVRSGSVRRVASAVGQGSTAVMLVHQYLRTL